MKVVQEIAGRISEALKEPTSCDELVTDENGRVWLIVRGDNVQFMIPDNGRTPYDAETPCNAQTWR